MKISEKGQGLVEYSFFILLLIAILRALGASEQYIQWWLAQLGLS